MARECAFCPEIATTGEHLWDHWLSKLLGEKTRYTIHRRMGDNALKWKSVGLNEKAPVLCDDCNHEWGSDTGTKMKNAVGSMITDGTLTKIDADAIAVIATYSVMKSFVCDYMQTEVESFYSLRERYAFRGDLTFPRGVQIWLAWTIGGHGVFKGVYHKAPLKTPARFQIYAFTISLGQLVIQVACPRYTKKSNRKYANPPVLNQAFFWNSFSLTIWPECIFPVPWPPLQQLRGEQLNAFVERWATIGLSG